MHRNDLFKVMFNWIITDWRTTQPATNIITSSGTAHGTGKYVLSTLPMSTSRSVSQTRHVPTYERGRTRTRQTVYTDGRQYQNPNMVYMVKVRFYIHSQYNLCFI